MAVDVNNFTPERALELLEAMSTPLRSDFGRFRAQLAELFHSAVSCQWIVAATREGANEPLIFSWGGVGQSVSQAELNRFSANDDVNPDIIFRQQVLPE